MRAPEHVAGLDAASVDRGPRACRRAGSSARGLKLASRGSAAAGHQQRHATGQSLERRVHGAAFDAERREAPLFVRRTERLRPQAA